VRSESSPGSAHSLRCFACRWPPEGRDPTHACT
jgi:hypothetical protein